MAAPRKSPGALVKLFAHLQQSTKSVQYLEMRPQPAPDTFNPGRGVNETCLNDANADANENDYDIIPMGCIVWPGDAVNSPVLVNQTEYIRTVGNLSDVNQVYLSTYNGKQYSMLGPAQTPDNLDFQATSFGSHTECRVVTLQCGARSTFRARIALPYYFNFICNETVAGLNMTGNFGSLGSSPTPQNESNDLHMENTNTLTTSRFTFGFQYFNDSAKQGQVTAPDTSGLSSVGPIKNTTNQFYWALAFVSDIRLGFQDAPAQTQNPWAYLGLVANDQGGPEGVLSCETAILEIVPLPFDPPTLTPTPIPIASSVQCV